MIDAIAVLTSRRLAKFVLIAAFVSGSTGVMLVELCRTDGRHFVADAAHSHDYSHRGDPIVLSDDEDRHVKIAHGTAGISFVVLLLFALIAGDPALKHYAQSKKPLR